MEFVLVNMQDAEKVYKLVQETIKSVYPKYYLQEIVDMFCEFHSKDNIMQDIMEGNMYISKISARQGGNRVNETVDLIELLYKPFRKEHISMRKLREIFNTAKKVIVSAVFAAEILLIPGGLAACSTDNGSASDHITLEKAEDIALADAEVTVSDITSIKTKSDTTNGIYDIEFYAGDVKYEYEIAAETGNVYSRRKETPANQENVPGETKQDMIPADETRFDTFSVSGEFQQNTNLLDTTGQNTPPLNETQSSPDAERQISLDDAKKAALSDAGLSSSDVIYTKEKLDYEDGIAVYDIEFYTNTMDYEYEVHATTGAIYAKDAETHHTRTGHGNHTQISGTYIGDDSARTIALNHAGISVPDITRLKSELDTDDGQAVYEVEFYKDGKEYEYKIDASDGTILKYEVD